MGKNNRSFWLYFAIIAGITVAILLINTYSPVAVKGLIEETAVHIEAVEEDLFGIQEKLGEYSRILDKLAGISQDERRLGEEIEAMERELISNNALIQAAFYQITKEQPDDILGIYIGPDGIQEVPLLEVVAFDTKTWKIEELDSEGEWKKGSYQETGEACFLYIRPVLRQAQAIGYIGLLFSAEGILEQIEQGAPRQNSFIFVGEADAKQAMGITDLASEQNFKASTGSVKAKGEQFFTYKKLATGMVYIEEYEGVKHTQYENEMILLISIFAIAAMWMIQKKDRTGRTVFNRVSDFIMKGYINKINTSQRQGNRATIALNIGMTVAIFADVLYSVALGRTIKTLTEYILFLGLSFSVLLLYKFSRTGITKKIAGCIIVAGLLGPLTEHIISGGFAGQRAGESFLWFIVCLYIALFILGPDTAVHVLSAVVTLLFFNVVLEIVMFQDTNYEKSYLFSIGFILLGFALYNAMEVYVSSAAAHYGQTKKLIKEIEKNQTLLMEKEKLGALGQLISGVAHEINTPIGAIKASAETMDSLFIATLQEVLDTAGELTSEEYDAFMELVSMTLEAKCEMKSTLEVRMAKREVKKYFEEINLENREQIITFLGELEIVNLTLIQERNELFRMDHSTKILERVTKLTAFASGIPIILYASDRVAQIVLALKSYVHTNAFGGSVEFDVTRSIENVLVLFRNQLKGNIKINKNYGDRPWIIFGNPDELAQVWTNLIQNAIYAMTDGGELTIALNEPDEMTVEVLIGDTGAGIVPEQLEKIFDPFFTTRQNGEGNGLGLSISKKIVEKHHGTLEAESHIKKGTVFSVRLKKTTEET